MNLLGMIEKELDEKVTDEWTDYDKALYVYFRTCEELSFDPAYLSSVDENERTSIYSKWVNAENLNKKEIVCRTWTCLYERIMRGVLGIDVCIHNDYGHSWCEFMVDDYLIEADATIDKYEDLTRAKNGDILRNFNVIDEDGNILKNLSYFKLIESLEKIGYTNLPFYSEYIYSLKEEKDNKESLKAYLGIDEDSLMFDRVDKKFNFLQSTTNMKGKRIVDVISTMKEVKNHFFTLEENDNIIQVMAYKDKASDTKYLTYISDENRQKLYVIEEKDGECLVGEVEDIEKYLVGLKSRNEKLDKIKTKVYKG